MGKSFKYKQLLQHLMTAINAGEFSVGDRLPTEKELAVRHQVSIQTVRQALLHLKNNGIIRQVSGSGTFLIRRPGTHDAEGGDAPHVAARNIGISVWNTSVHVFPRIIHSIEQEVFGFGSHVIACSTDDDANQERQIFERLINQGIIGLIVSPMIWHERRLDNYDFLIEQGIPFVLINRKIPNIGVSSVIIDNELGGYRATHHLIHLGHRNIGHLTSDVVSDLTEDRIRGYRRALQEGGLAEQAHWVQRTPSGVRQVGYEGARQLLDRPDRPTAVFCVNDEHAIGLMQAARELKLQVPRDLSIVSFDNSAVAKSHFPIGLDSIDYPAEEMGVSAVRELYASMDDQRWVPKCICLEPELIVRQSSAMPASMLEPPVARG